MNYFPAADTVTICMTTCIQAHSEPVGSFTGPHGWDGSRAAVRHDLRRNLLTTPEKAIGSPIVVREQRRLVHGP